MAKDGKRGLTPEQWVEARNGFLCGDSISALSERFGIRRQTIRDRATRERWMVDGGVQVDGRNTGEPLSTTIAKRTMASVTDISIKRAMAQVEASGVVDSIAEELLATIRAKQSAARFIVAFLERAERGEIVPANMPAMRDESQVAKDIMGAYKIFSSTIREDAGIKPGTATLDTNANKKEATTIQWSDTDRAETA